MSTVTDDEAKTTLSANVVRLMGERGWRQIDLANATGENEMTISNVCRGKHAPRAGLLQRIAEALGVSIDALLEPQKKLRRA